MQRRMTCIVSSACGQMGFGGKLPATWRAQYQGQGKRVVLLSRRRSSSKRVLSESIVRSTSALVVFSVANKAVRLLTMTGLLPGSKLPDEALGILYMLLLLLSLWVTRQPILCDHVLHRDGLACIRMLENPTKAYTGMLMQAALHHHLILQRKGARL